MPAVIGREAEIIIENVKEINVSAFILNCTLLMSLFRYFANLISDFNCIYFLSLLICYSCICFCIILYCIDLLIPSE